MQKKLRYHKDEKFR